MKQVICLLVLIFFLRNSFAQKIFTEDEFIAAVKTFHPLARQAALDVKIAAAQVTSSRSGFDPVISSEKNRKEIEGIEYYFQEVNQLKIPTWYGVDIVAGRENISGDRLNPEETKGSVSYLGISVPVLKNLVIDQRRASLLQAKQYLLQSEMQRLQVINDLHRDALHAYWNWWETFQQYQVVESSRISAEKRFEMIRTFVKTGERPAIDTIEALTIVQFFFQKQSEALMELQKARIALSGFLWKEQDQVYDLPADVNPQQEIPQKNIALAEALQSAENHPELRQFQYKLSALEIEKKLKFQSLLPGLHLKYNQLGKEKTFMKTVNSTWFDNNYQFGFSLSMPLRLSEGRGEYRKAKFYIEQMKLEQVNKTVQIKNKLRQHFTEWQNTREQLAIQELYVNNIYRLQKGEESKFLNGESSLFLINAREIKTLESKEKLVQLKAKNIRSYIDLKWSTGFIE
jgi:outer membrane protein TolC